MRFNYAISDMKTSQTGIHWQIHGHWLVNDSNDKIKSIKIQFDAKWMIY